MTSVEDALWDLRQGGQRLECYVEDFLELSNWVSWHNATLGVCFQLGLDDETIRCDLSVCDFPLLELITVILFFNCSKLEVKEIKETSKSRSPDPAGTRRISPAHPTPRTSTYLTNGSYPHILQSSTLVLSPETPSAVHSRPPSAAKSSLPPSVTHSRPPSATHPSPPLSVAPTGSPAAAPKPVTAPRKHFPEPASSKCPPVAAPRKHPPVPTHPELAPVQATAPDQSQVQAPAPDQSPVQAELCSPDWRHFHTTLRWVNTLSMAPE